MVLSDKELKRMIEEGEFGLDPLLDANIHAASIDLTLGDKISYCNDSHVPINPVNDIAMCYKEVEINDGYILEPGKFVLGSAMEYIKLPLGVIGVVYNRSTLARMGISVNASSYVNPGYEGNLPLAINNFGNIPVTLIPGVRVCQLVLYTLSGKVMVPYPEQEDAKYQGEKGIGLPKLYLDREIKNFLTTSQTVSVEDEDLGRLQLFLKEQIESTANEIVDNYKKKSVCG